MSEVIVRMEMPKGCGYCRIAQFGYCGITHEPVADAYMGYPENRPKTCPIIAVLPENHGRLVDADALRDEWLYETGTFEPNDVLDSIDYATTIVPAERRKV